MNREELLKLPKGERGAPICFAYNKDHIVYLPVLEFSEFCIIWDGGQITREEPPSEAYEVAQWEDFDFDKPIYFPNRG